MNKYRWEAAYLSFFSRDFYRDVARNWKGVGYLYLLLLLVALCAITAIGMQVQANAIFTKHVDPIVAQWPKMTIANGEMSVDKPMPYIIDAGENYIIDFDTSDSPKWPDGKRGWLIGKTSVVANNVGAQPEENKTVMDLKQLSSSSTTPMVIDQPTVVYWSGIIRNGIGIFVFVFRTVQLLLFCMIQSLLYALVAMAVASAMKVELTYGTLVRLAVVAMTPGLIIETITLATGFPIPFWGLLSILVSLGYLIFAVAANKPAEESAVTTPVT